jgi:hypothetical protein
MKPITVVVITGSVVKQKSGARYYSHVAWNQSPRTFVYQLRRAFIAIFKALSQAHLTKCRLPHQPRRGAILVRGDAIIYCFYYFARPPYPDVSTAIR